MQNETSKQTRLIRLSGVQERTGLSRATVYDRMNPRSPRYDDTFPRQVKIGLSAVAWSETEIDSWIQSQIDISRAIQNLSK
jgi:prophage regulatory protein